GSGKTDRPRPAAVARVAVARGSLRPVRGERTVRSFARPLPADRGIARQRAGGGGPALLPRPEPARGGDPARRNGADRPPLLDRCSREALPGPQGRHAAGPRPAPGWVRALRRTPPPADPLPRVPPPQAHP